MWDKRTAIADCPDPRLPASPAGARRWPRPLDAARAFGVADHRFHKMVQRRKPGPERRQDARGEFDLLRRCGGLAGVPEAIELIEDAHQHVIVLQRVPGRPLSDLELGWPSFARVMLQLARLVWAMARRGVRHNDLRPENIMIAEGGLVHLVDFDQARTGSLG